MGKKENKTKESHRVIIFSNSMNIQGISCLMKNSFLADILLFKMVIKLLRGHYDDKR